MANPAEGYEGYMVPTLFGPWATRLVQTADPRPGEGTTSPYAWMTAQRRLTTFWFRASACLSSKLRTSADGSSQARRIEPGRR